MKNSLIIIGVFIFFYILERKYPLRVEKMRKSSRVKDNLLLAVLGIPFTRFLAYPIVYKVALNVEKDHVGLLQHLVLNEVLLIVLSFLLLDYLLYWWHRLNHRISFLWRFHQVHHADPEMDASTALRFHFGELLLSSGLRVILILVFGFPLKILLAFDVLVTCCALFHHSNLKLPYLLEKSLIRFIVTPHFHQNHHSYFQKETDSNFSAIFSVWDRIHRTHTKEIASSEITIGLPAIGKVMPGFLNLVVMPVKKVSAWPLKFISRDLSQ